MKTEEYNKQV